MGVMANNVYEYKLGGPGAWPLKENEMKLLTGSILTTTQRYM